MKHSPDQPSQNPDEPALPGEVERDNDALRPNDPKERDAQDDVERVEDDLENLHDKARPL